MGDQRAVDSADGNKSIERERNTRSAHMRNAGTRKHAVWLAGVKRPAAGTSSSRHAHTSTTERLEASRLVDPPPVRIRNDREKQGREKQKVG
ncbi:hypothetical protein EYF80_045440 [Liparis tanakae]|uniref:Uncharacterized protein n=1 Tax=Liparis tanakae TaxID=230148 RepID=A0A4Z2FUL6_9TELE|nr:hypothetical protein EYF80_045440 [Liparis tanakae]